jgi:hypothetical protein
MTTVVYRLLETPDSHAERSVWLFNDKTLFFSIMESQPRGSCLHPGPYKWSWTATAGATSYSYLFPGGQCHQLVDDCLQSLLATLMVSDRAI